jgi:hypothetical protein
MAEETQEERAKALWDYVRGTDDRVNQWPEAQREAFQEATKNWVQRSEVLSADEKRSKIEALIQDLKGVISTQKNVIKDEKSYLKKLEQRLSVLEVLRDSEKFPL